jgi:hypothetical protein
VKSLKLRQLNRVLSGWESRLSSHDWYLTVVPEIEIFNLAIKNESAEVKSAYKAVLYDFFENHLARGNVALSANIGNAAERQPIDTIVIHHQASFGWGAIARSGRPREFDSVSLGTAI